MNDEVVIAVVVGLLAIVSFSVLAARAEKELWRKCRRSESRRRMQQRITMGKSQLR